MHEPSLPRRLCLVAGSLSLAGWPGLPRAQAGTTRLMSLRDPVRQRELPLLIRFPAGSGPCPVVLYSHGLGGTRQGGEVWGEAWRAQGIAVVHLQHPGSDADVLRDGGPEALRDAANAEQLLARVRDLRFVIDEIVRAPTRQESPLLRLDVEALGVAGHSFGAVSVQALAGQRFPAGGDFSDVRPRAFVALSPSPARVQVGTPYAEIKRPFLAVTGSLDGDPLAGTRNGEARLAVFDGLPAGQRALLWLDGADHMTFAGNSARRQAALAAAAAAATASASAALAPTGPASAATPASLLRRREAPTIDREGRHHALIGRLTAQWWRAHLLGDGEATAQLRSPSGLGPGDRWKV